MKTSSKVNEVLDILQEECGEVIVAISKIRRFGIDNQYKDGGTQREHLIQELGDVTLLIELLKAHNIFTEAELHAAQVRKSQKLVKWSNIYENQS
jgi:NTP pyrophosphatase (non-canonical NTP hydrolase)